MNSITPMTKERFKERLKEINEEHKEQKDSLIRAFAISNNTHKEGDIVTDHVGSIKIEKIRFAQIDYEEIPSCCVYEGLELKKDGTPMKRNTKRHVFQTNLIY